MNDLFLNLFIFISIFYFIIWISCLKLHIKFFSYTFSIIIYVLYVFYCHGLALSLQFHYGNMILGIINAIIAIIILAFYICLFIYFNLFRNSLFAFIFIYITFRTQLLLFLRAYYRLLSFSKISFPSFFITLYHFLRKIYSHELFEYILNDNNFFNILSTVIGGVIVGLILNHIHNKTSHKR